MLMLKLIAMAFLLASCVEAPELASRPAPELPEPLDLEAFTADPDPDPEDCSLTVADTGLCANACDAAAVAAFAEPGTCVMAQCELMDGRVIRVGGCR